MVTAPVRHRAFGSAVGLVADRIVGEPPTALHPVAAFGRLMQHVERRVYRDTRESGVVYAATGAATGAIAGAFVRSTAAAVWGAAAGRMLRAEAGGIQHSLEVGDLACARTKLPALVGRDASRLDESGVAAAVIESLAENTVDAVVAPALWGAALGAPGALVYRAINTMDAMVGHRSDRYERFGWASARLDDIANYLPARVSVVLVCLACPARAPAVVRAVRFDARAHPSPNAGVAEAAFAAALDLEVGGTLQYAGRVEPRPGLGTGRRPATDDIDRAVRLADRVPGIRAVNLGGVHHEAGRNERLRYLFLTPGEETALRALTARGVEVTARDVPTARPLPLEDVLARRAT